MGEQADPQRGGWLTETDIKAVRSHHIREAVRALRSGSVSHGFAASTH